MLIIVNIDNIMKTPILFLARKGLEFSEIKNNCAKEGIEIIRANSLNEFLDYIHLKVVLVMVIEDEYLNTLIDVPKVIYKLLSLSNVKIKLVIGKKGVLSKIPNTEFDAIISDNLSVEQKCNEINLYWEASKIIFNVNERLGAATAPEKLEITIEEIQKKDRRISSLYIQLLEYKNMLKKNYEDWVQLDLPLNNQKVRKYYASLRSNSLIINNEWEEFSEHFVEVHPNFFEKLKQISSKLTEENLKMCAYLKMGVGNNEIANYMCIQEGSVKKTQTRIKKKLQLPHERSLRSFIKNMQE